MARMYPHQALNQLIYAPTTPTAAQFATLAGLTASAAELNVLDTSAVGTVSPSKAMTVDANYQVSGWRRKSVDMDGGVQQAGGKYITADAIGEYVHVICAKAGQWATLDYRGTWGVEG